MQHVDVRIRHGAPELLRVENGFLLFTCWPEALTSNPRLIGFRKELVAYCGQACVIHFDLALDGPEPPTAGRVFIPFPIVGRSTKNQLPWAANFSAPINGTELVYLPG